MASGFYDGPFGSNPFDDFFQAFMGQGAGRRGMQRVDITQLLSGSSREVVSSAARPDQPDGEPRSTRADPAVTDTPLNRCATSSSG